MTDESEAHHTQTLENLLDAVTEQHKDDVVALRSSLVQINKKILAALGKTAEKVVDVLEYEQYIFLLVESCITKGLDIMPNTPPSLQGKERLKKHKEIIEAVLFEVGITSTKETSDPLMKCVISYLTKADDIASLRAALRLWRAAQLTYAKMEAVKEENQLICDNMEQVCSELLALQKKRETEDWVIHYVEKDDENLALAIKAHKLFKQGMGRRVIAKELNVPERKVRTLLTDYEFE